MTVRKKKGVITMVSGVIFIVVGAIIYGTTLTPAWVGQAVVLIGMVGQFFGFIFVFPDTE